MKNKYKKSVSSFLIVLILVMPFYVSSVFAQINTPAQVLDPAASCLSKKVDSDDFVETLDSGAIKTLETIASTLYFTCTAWSTVEVAKNTYRSIIGTPDNCHVPQYPVLCAQNALDKIADIPLAKQFQSLCDLAECKYASEKIANSDEIFQSVKDVSATLGSFQQPIRNLGLGPFDNIYTSIAMMCPIGILHNLRKLKTIYQTHSCCIQEACTSGVSTESCERQLSEATCMYWEGSIALSAIKILMNFLSKVITNFISDDIREFIGEGKGYFIEVIFALSNAYDHIQKLQQSFQWISRTFSEPTCEDLNFGNIRDDVRARQRPGTCSSYELVGIDLNRDGLNDRFEQRCIV